MCYIKKIPVAIAVLTACLFALYACDRATESHPVLLRAEQLMDQHPDSALMLLDSIIPSTLSEAGHAHWCLLITQARDKNYITHTSDSLIRISCDYYTEHADQDRLMKAYYYRGRVNQDIGDARQAQEYYLKASDAGTISTDSALKARIYSNLGVLYSLQDDTPSAVSMMEKALDYFRQMRDTSAQSTVLQDIARAWHLSDSLDRSLYYYQQALALASPDNIAYPLNEIGGIWLDKKEYDQAFAYLHAALKALPPFLPAAPVYLILGEAHLQTGNVDSARFYLTKSACSDNPRTIASAYFHLYHLERQERNLQAYSLAQEKYERLNDSIQQENIHETIQRLQRLYDYSQLENKVKEEEWKHAATQRDLNFISAVAFLLFLLSAGCVYSLYTSRKRVKEQKVRLDSTFDSLAEANPTILESLNKFKTTELFSKFAVEAEKSDDITGEDWKALEKKLCKISPGFRPRLKVLYPSISRDIFRLCYLTVLDIKPFRIGTLTNINHISKVRARLCLKMTGEKSSADELDNLVKSLFFSVSTS